MSSGIVVTSKYAHHRKMVYQSIHTRRL